MIFKTYGLTLALAVLLGAFVSSLEAKRRDKSPDLVWDVLLLVLIGGIIGARLYHVFSLWGYYQRNLLAVLFLWDGGLGIFGALGGGLLGLAVWKGIRGVKGIKAGEMLDIAAPGLAIGQAVGRFANYFNQELYGWPTNLPWGIYIAPAKRFPGLENFEFFQPLFLYEALWNLFNFLLILYVGKKFTHLRGEIFLLYLGFYALGRFFLEGLRIYSWTIGGLRVAQVLSLLIIFASMAVTVMRRSGREALKLGV